jgi:uncharacterized paraquat-inducible protein A
MQQTNPAADRLILHCPKCDARLVTSRQKIGQSGSCPRCQHRIIVRVNLPSDSDIALVPHDGR